MRRKLITLFFCSLPFLVIAQKKITISGYVKDLVSREALIGAPVINANAKSGTTTNPYGFYSFTARPADTIELIVSFNGYKLQAKKIATKENLRLDILLEFKLITWVK